MHVKEKRTEMNVLCNRIKYIAQKVSVRCWMQCILNIILSHVTMFTWQNVRRLRILHAKNIRYKKSDWLWHWNGDAKQEEGRKRLAQWRCLKLMLNKRCVTHFKMHFCSLTRLCSKLHICTKNQSLSFPCFGRLLLANKKILLSEWTNDNTTNALHRRRHTNCSMWNVKYVKRSQTHSFAHV